jgi:hypothetical protein
MERHDFDPIAMIAGVVFTGVGLVFLAGHLDALGGVRWLWPSLLVLLGLVTLLGTLGRGRGAASASSGAGQVPSLTHHDPLPLDIPELDLTDTSELFKIPGWEQAKARSSAEAAEPAEAETEQLRRDPGHEAGAEPPAGE